MSAFAAAFLANPFEDEALGQTTDAMGNIFNANGQHIGVKPGSQADVGGTGYAVTPTGSTAPTASAAAGTGSDLTAIPSNPGAAAAAGVGSSTSSGIWSKLLSFARKATGIDAVENIVFVLLGLLLIAAGIFSFKPVRDTVVSVGRAAVA